MNCCNFNCRQGRDCPRRRQRDISWRGALTFLRAVRRWAMRFAASVLMLVGFMPAPLQVVWLEWLRDDLPPTDPRLPIVLIEIAQVKEMCRA